MLTLALSSWSLHRHLPYFGRGTWSPDREGEELSILDFPDVAARHNIHQVEICQMHLATTDRAYLDDVRAALLAAGCRVVNVPIDVGNMAEVDPAKRAADIRAIAGWIDAAHHLGSPAIRVNTGQAGDLPEEEAIVLAAAGYRQLADHCAPLGMSILLENHGGLSASPAVILALLEAVDRPNFRLCPDFGNFAPDDRERGLRLMLPHAAVVHAKVMDPGESGYDLGRCLEIVRQSDFSGPISLEFEGRTDQYAGIERAAGTLHAWLAGIQPAGGAGPRRRVAIFGGGMVANWHVEGWRKAGAEVVSAVDVDPPTLERFVDTHGIAGRHTDYRAFLASDEARTVDIVDVCAPPWLHAPMSIAALQAGKHVLCEKPFALSSDQASSMADAAEAAGRVLACRQGATRLAWEARIVKEIVQSGKLGEVYFLRLVTRSLYRPGIEYNPGASWFLDRRKAGGGALYDLGVYDLELLFGIFGPIAVSNVMAATFTGVDDPEIDTPFDVEEHAVAMLELAGGIKAYWEQGWATHLPIDRRWEFYGSRGGLSFVAHSWVIGVEMDLRLTRFAPEKTIELPLPPQPERGPSVYQDFLTAVDTGSLPASPARECAQMLAIIEQVYDAAGAGQPALSVG